MQERATVLQYQVLVPVVRAKYTKREKGGPELKTVFIALEMKFAMTESHFPKL